MSVLMHSCRVLSAALRDYRRKGHWVPGACMSTMCRLDAARGYRCVPMIVTTMVMQP